MKRILTADIDAGRIASDDDEDRLVAAIRNGDRHAFERLYRRHRPRLTRFVANLVRTSPLLADEVVSETLMVLWERPSAFAGTSRLSTWLFAIAYRKAIKARTVHGRTYAADGAAEQPYPAPDATIESERVAKALHRAMFALSPDHRTVIDLTYFHEMGYREIAEIMACPVDTVKTRMFHARRHLREALNGRMDDWM